MFRLWALLLFRVAAAEEEVCEAGSCASGPTDRDCRDVLEVLDASTEEVWKRKQPAVITGVPEAAGWDVKAFRRERLRRDFGKERVKVFSPAQAALLQGQTARSHPLSHVLSKLKAPAGGQLLYVFDKDFFSKAPKLAPVPRWLAQSGSDKLLTLGGPRSGTQFHAHGAAFLALLVGRKRWYFHELGHFPNESVKSLNRDVEAWEAEVLPMLGATAPLACVQRAGDTIYVPDSWAHATINVEETAGVAWQRFTTNQDTCKHGHDYMCLLQQFATAERMNPAKQPARFRELFAEVEALAGGLAMGCLRYLGPFWRSSGEAKEVFKRQMNIVKEMLKAAPPRSDAAILAGALIKALVDALFTAKPKHLDKASTLLRSAVRKAPEGGHGVALAQLLGKQGRWTEAAEQLQVHLLHFPEDVDAQTMLGQAKGFAAQR